MQKKEKRQQNHHYSNHNGLKNTMLLLEFSGCQFPVLATYTPESTFPVSQSLTDLHTSTSKNYHPNAIVHQQELAPLSQHFPFVTTSAG